jgi:PIN domain nuclease of toxin-antitoxin system
MSYLLDTCSFLWLTLNDSQLSAPARQAIIDPANLIFLSAASVWEICVKYDLGKLPLPSPPEQFFPYQRTAHQILPLGIEETDVIVLRQLPTHHKDPFDRMLVCQTLAQGLTILTPDPHIRQYAIPTLWWLFAALFGASTLPRGYAVVFHRTTRTTAPEVLACPLP